MWGDGGGGGFDFDEPIHNFTLPTNRWKVSSTINSTSNELTFLRGDVTSD